MIIENTANYQSPENQSSTNKKCDIKSLKIRFGEKNHIVPYISFIADMSLIN